MQELIDAKATATIGAGRYQRTQARVTERNGSRPRLLTTHAGDVHLAVPKLRAGSFFPSILSPRRRIDQALYAVVTEAYVHGVSTRSVDDLVVALGGTGISKSEVSRICAGLDAAADEPGAQPCRSYSTRSAVMSPSATAATSAASVTIGVVPMTSLSQ